MNFTQKINHFDVNSLRKIQFHLSILFSNFLRFKYKLVRSFPKLHSNNCKIRSKNRLKTIAKFITLFSFFSFFFLRSKIRLRAKFPFFSPLSFFCQLPFQSGGISFIPHRPTTLTDYQVINMTFFVSCVILGRIVDDSGKVSFPISPWSVFLAKTEKFFFCFSSTVEVEEEKSGKHRNAHEDDQVHDGGDDRRQTHKLGSLSV